MLLFIVPILLTNIKLLLVAVLFFIPYFLITRYALAVLLTTGEDLKANLYFYLLHSLLLSSSFNFLYNANSCANSLIRTDILEIATVSPKMIHKAKQNPTKKSILMGCAIPNTSANYIIEFGKISKTRIPIPTISQANAYFSSSCLFLIILTIIYKAIIMKIAIIICVLILIILNTYFLILSIIIAKDTFII